MREFKDNGLNEKLSRRGIECLGLINKICFENDIGDLIMAKWEMSLDRRFKGGKKILTFDLFYFLWLS